MFDNLSSVSQLEPATLELGIPTEPPIEVSSKKIKQLLKRYKCFPFNSRKVLWGYVLQLPNNTKEFRRYRDKPHIQKAKELCKDKKVSEEAFIIVNSLIHWHAPLINCDWLPGLVQKLVTAFPKSPIFCFEVVLTMLTNLFSEWLSELPGPPPDVLTRIDSILSLVNHGLRQALGTGLVAWSSYRSLFSDTLYDRPWLELMDFILCSSPQFFEFCVVSWLCLNETQLRADYETFNMVQRPGNAAMIVEEAKRISKIVIPILTTNSKFRPLPKDHYPINQAHNDTVVLRTLQSDLDKVTELQKQLAEEKKQSDEAEAIKVRKQQIYDSISKLNRQKEMEEKIAASKAASDLEKRMRLVRLESVKMKQSEERHFIERWIHEWDRGLDFTTSSLATKIGDKTGDIDQLVEEADARLASMMNLRQADVLLRESRRTSTSRSRYASSELEVQAHQRALRAEIARLGGDPNILLNSSEIKTRNGN